MTMNVSPVTNLSLVSTSPKVSRSPKIGAALELLGYLASIAGATLCFLPGWLSCDQAAVCTLLLLASLLALAWRQFDGGRHPCFFFLCMLTLFQGGRIVAYCAGGVTDIFRVTLMTQYPFDLSRNVAGLALLSIALSAVCIYAPGRWHHRASYSSGRLPGQPPGSESFSRFLPYLYLLFWLSMPVQLYKNFCYYQYASDHGGYLVVFTDHGGMAASVPWPVRAVSLLSLPVFVGIFILEKRKRLLRLATIVYFAITAPILLLGSRGGIFSLVLALWYVAKVKSGRRARWHSVALLGAGLVLAGSFVGWFRSGKADASALAGPSQFIAGQGTSLNVTEVAIAYRQHFAPHIFFNLADELRSGFFPTDHRAYVAGKNFDADVSMFLNPAAYQMGSGGGSSYVAEAYLAGGLGGVAIVSLLLGVLFHKLHTYARNPVGLFVAGMILPNMLLMPRGGLLDWVSGALRDGLSVLLLLAGWYGYRALIRLGGVLTERHSVPDCPAPARA